MKTEKNKGGRPPTHTDPEEVQKLVDEYFDSLTGEVDKEKFEIPPTITGLTLALGFSNKASLYDYSEKEEFAHVIKTARTRIEHYSEKQVALGEKCTGNIFILKNMDWHDSIKQEIKSDSDIKISFK